jgi:hypothetical protein
MKEERPNEIGNNSEAGVTHGSDNRLSSPIPQDSRSPANERTGPGATTGNEAKQSLSVRKASGPRSPEGKQKTRRNALTHGIFATSVLVKGESRAAYDLLLDGLTESAAPVGKLEEVLVEKLATNLWRQGRLIQAEGAEIQKGIDLMDWEQQIRISEETRRSDLSSLTESEPGLFLKTDNPFALKRCLDLLAELREQIAENGFTDSDLQILTQLYGDANKTNLGDNLGDDLHDEYLSWSETASASKAERLREGYATPEECKQYVLEAINTEIRRLKEYQKVEGMRRLVPESRALERLLRYEVTLERSFDRTLSQLERLQRLRLGQPVPPRIDVNLSSS